MIELTFIKENIHINLSQQPQEIAWCGNRAVVLQLQNQELYLISTGGDIIRIDANRGEKEKWSLLKEEIDGVRIITRKENKILRELPPAYTSVFQTFS